MYFQIRQIILWPKRGTGKRVVDFQPGMVNVISGPSKTGKSAVIPIIDYCLASGKCAIPVGVIRDACAWFGIVVDTAEGQKLFARREPEDQRQTGDMFILEANAVEIPEQIDKRNATTNSAKRILDRIAGLTTLSFDPESESGYKMRPSFRDLMAFTFQPQNVVANPDVMFFKADTTEHREKLKTIFPYVLNAVTPEVLAARWEIQRLQQQLRRAEAELKAALSSVNVWRTEALGWIRQAIDVGLIPTETALPEEWPDILDLLRTIAAGSFRTAHTSLPSVEVSLTRLEVLRRNEEAVAADLSAHRQRLNEIRRLLQSSESYGSAIRVRRDRLALSEWLKVQPHSTTDTLVAISDQRQQDLDALCDALEGIETELRSHPMLSDKLDKEHMRLRGLTELGIGKLSEVRQEIIELERNSAHVKEAAYRSDQIERFLGRLEQALKLYDKADENAELRQNITNITSQIDELRKIVSEQEIRRKLNNARRTIESIAAKIIPTLDAEWLDAPINLMTDDLTIKVVQGSRDNYLWEIGSGANWLSYHVALTLALQRFFLSEPHHPVPGLLIYDQPSQVYFPRRAADVHGPDEVEWRDEDVVAVRKVFTALGAEVQQAHGRLQIIVLDHADDDVWGGIDGVSLTEEWRGKKLVPMDWQLV